MQSTQKSTNKPEAAPPASVSTPSVYLVGLIDIKDRNEYNKYIDGFRPIFARYHGEILVIEETPTVLEGDWNFTRTVIIRFPDEAEAKRWYESEDYQNLATHRFRAAQSKIILAKGRI